MASEAQVTGARWRGMAMLRWLDALRQREDRILLILSLVVGVLTGLAVVAFILLTERLGMRLYPVGSAAWRRVLIPMAGSLGMGFLLWRYFPGRARQRRAANQGGAVCARRRDHRSGRCSENFSARRRRSRAEFPWDAKDPRCKWARESLRCSDGGWGCGRRA